MAKCIYCGTNVGDNEKYCTNCGANIEKQRDTEKQSSTASEVDETVKTSESKSNSSKSNEMNYPPYIKKANDNKSETVSIGMYVGALILMMIPGVNLVMAIVWACGGTKNKNLTNFGRAALILILVLSIITVIFCGVAGFAIGSMSKNIFGMIDDETGGMLSQFGINDWEHIKDYSTMDEEEAFDKIDSNFDNKLSDYGIYDMQDLAQAYEDGTFKEVLKDFGYTEEQINKVFDNEGIHVHVDDETGDVDVDIDSNGVDVDVS